MATFDSTPVKQVSYTYRAFTPEGAIQFSELLARQTWDEVLTAEGADAKAEAYQLIASHNPVPIDDTPARRLTLGAVS